MLACKLISRQLRTQYVKGIYRPNYPVTLKSKGYSRTGHYGNGTIEYRPILHELFDVEYYRDLEV